MKPTFKALLRDPSAMTGAAIILMVVCLALLAPVLGGDPNFVDPVNRLKAPQAAFPLGTDDQGRDMWTMVLFGAQTALGISALCTVLAVVIGYLIGIICGYFPKVDAVVMRIIDGMMSFPNIILVMSLVGVLGRGVGPVVFGLTVVLIPPIARVVRSASLSMKSTAMVESARAMGAKDSWILSKYVAPEAVSVLIVQATMGFAATVLSIAALSFLGIGIPPEVPSWGASLSAAQKYIAVAWWIGVFPGVAILVTVLGLILLGDGLRDSMDPRARRIAGLAKLKTLSKVTAKEGQH
ncbi:ABC transporter permease [Paeniglutamicibacter psychrophenolicus]|uniref:Peptide/nickel transport system permease protein n=1 Tax=Paeniglutamicibacter psychrophenolicus TaxID=257454 RepID=A0ABS4W9U3_9MICC|nr:ABC transporter permease [Paeniglutamicibacter psychrophenolicus]MBP2372903.1 peptide/nickel transport system permease protein [Paeniglutamicibacter psychrophenolicus]